MGGCNMKVLVTGTAGFISFHTARYLLARGDDVVGLDAVNDYYDPGLKEARLRVLSDQSGKGQGAWTFVRAVATTCRCSLETFPTMSPPWSGRRATARVRRLRKASRGL